MKKTISFLITPNGRALLIATLVLILLAVFWNQFDDRKWGLILSLCVTLLILDNLFALQLYEPGRWSNIVWVYRAIYFLLTLGIITIFAVVIIRSGSESKIDFALQFVFNGSMMFTVLWRWFAFAWNKKRIYAQPA